MQRVGVQYKHMVNILLKAQYALITINMPYVMPPNPGQPPFIAIGSTAVQLVKLV